MSTQPSYWQTVFANDWKQLRRSSSFTWLTALLLFIGMYAIIYGRNEVKEQQRKITLLQNKIDSLYKNLADSLQLHDTTASYVGSTIGRVHANWPDGLAALAFGQRDIHKFAQQVTNGGFFYNKYSTGYANKTLSGEIVNPFKLLSGHLDISFVFIFLFPLYFILIGYNVFSAEKEAGTLGLLGVQPVSVSSIVNSKLLLRFIIVTLLGLVLLLIAASVNKIMFDIRWFWFAAAFTAYIFCWLGIISLIVSLKKDSGFNALTLVSTWIVFTLLLPALLNGVLNYHLPVTAKTELGAAVQKANAEVWEIPKSKRVDSFKILRPDFAKTFDTVGDWPDQRNSRIVSSLIDHYIEKFEQKRVAGVLHRAALASKLNYFSPALLAQFSFTELSGSNMAQVLAYDTATYTYFKKISRFTDDYIFRNGNRFQKDDLAKMPLYEFEPNIQYAIVAWQILLMFLLGALALFASNKKNKIKPVK